MISTMEGDSQGAFIGPWMRMDGGQPGLIVEGWEEH